MPRRGGEAAFMQIFHIDPSQREFPLPKYIAEISLKIQKNNMADFLCQMSSFFIF